jgi:hypothetical protein
VDGGATWQRSTVGSASVQQSEDGTGPMNLSFVDGRHGWLRVDALWETGDGGRTWTTRRSDLTDRGFTATYACLSLRMVGGEAGNDARPER